MRFSKVLVSILVANLILYAWVWNLIYLWTGVEPLESLTRNLYVYTGGELALAFAASAVGDRVDLAKAKAGMKKPEKETKNG